jgi:hypothetical protein
LHYRQAAPEQRVKPHEQYSERLFLIHDGGVYTGEAVPKLQFWNSNLRFNRKSSFLDRFFESQFHRKQSLRTNRVLELAQVPAQYFYQLALGSQCGEGAEFFPF